MFRRFLFLEFLARLFRFRFEFQIFDNVFRRLRYHVTDVVKSLAACTACNLVEISGGQNSRLVATVLAELRKQYRSNWNIHAHAERVGAADDFE